MQAIQNIVKLFLIKIRRYLGTPKEIYTYIFFFNNTIIINRGAPRLRFLAVQPGNG